MNIKLIAILILTFCWSSFARYPLQSKKERFAAQALVGAHKISQHKINFQKLKIKLTPFPVKHWKGGTHKIDGKTYIIPDKTIVPTGFWLSLNFDDEFTYKIDSADDFVIYSKDEINYELYSFVVDKEKIPYLFYINFSIPKGSATATINEIALTGKFVMDLNLPRRKAIYMAPSNVARSLQGFNAFDKITFRNGWTDTSDVKLTLDYGQYFLELEYFTYDLMGLSILLDGKVVPVPGPLLVYDRTTQTNRFYALSASSYPSKDKQALMGSVSLIRLNFNNRDKLDEFVSYSAFSYEKVMEPVTGEMVFSVTPKWNELQGMILPKDYFRSLLVSPQE